MYLHSFIAIFILASITPITKGVTTELTFNNGTYIVRATTSATSIEFYIAVKTYGWIGLGVGPNSNMTNVDMVIGERYNNNNTVTSTDMHTKNTGTLIADTKRESDWDFVSGYANATLTTRTYTRLLKTTDPNAGQDYEIKDEDLFLIWAYGTSPNMSGIIENQGYAKVNLLRQSATTTTETPTTERPTTESPTTERPTTESPTTESPTTESPTTESPTTENPTTESPTTERPEPESDSVLKEHSFDNGAYNLTTEAFKSEGAIRFDLTVRTSGWVGVGVGPNSNMMGADFVIGGVNDNNRSVYYADMYANRNGEPIIDSKAASDWFLFGASQSGGVTMMSYIRLYRSKDGNSNQDFEIKDEELYLLMAYGANDTVSYHSSKRTSVKVNLRSGANFLASITVILCICTTMGVAHLF